MPRWAFANRTMGSCLSTIALLCLLSGCSRDPVKVRDQAIARGDRAVQNLHFDNAIIEYKNAVKAEPRNEEGHLKLGQAYAKTSQLRDAGLQFQQVLAISPQNQTARLALGQIYLKAGMYEDALQLAKTVLATSPGNVDARLLMANANVARGMTSQAILDLQSLSHEQPAQVGVHLNLGLIYATVHKNELAETELRKALALQPDSFDGRKALAAFYLSTGRYDEAEQLYRAAAKDAPQSAEVLLTLAQFLALRQRSADAEQVYQALVQVQNNSAQSRFALANFYMTQRRFDEARKVYEKISEEDKDFFQARLQMGEIALLAGDLERAESVLAPLLRERKNIPDVQIMQARIQLGRNRPQQAADVLENLLKQGNSAATHYLLGIAHSQLGNLQRAVSEMEAAISADRHFVNAYVALAQMMLSRGQPKAALRYSNLAMQQEPRRSDLLLLMGNAWLDEGNYANAEASFKAYAVAMPQSSEALSRLGSLRVLQKRPADAIACFEKARQLDPNDYGALDGIISTLVSSGYHAKAEQRVRAELARQSSPQILNIAGKALANLGDMNSAEALLKSAIEKAPDNFTSYILLGSVYARRKQVPETIRVYESALRIRKNDVGLMNMLGMLYQEQGEVKKAQEIYNRVLDVDPNSGVAANNLAWIYADSVGDMDKALELARRARLALPRVANVTDTLGWIYSRRQHNSLAIPLLREAVKADPKSGEYRFHLAVALQRSGQKDEARQEITSALKLNAALRSRDEAQEILRVR